jgi:hypothetical protein
MPQISLFDFEAQLAELQIIPVLAPESVPVEVAEEIQVLTAQPTVHLPTYQEKKWLLEQAENKSGSITLVRIGRKHIAAVPLDLDAAMMLEAYRDSEANIVTSNQKTSSGNWKVVIIKDGSDPKYPAHAAELPGLIRACIPIDSKKEHDRRVYFPFDNLFGADPTQTFLYRHLTNAGFNVILTPTVQKWIKREYARMTRELATYDLPEIKDRRPLFDQMEEGLLLRCTADVGSFEHDQRYLVTSLKDDSGSEHGVVLQKLLGEGDAASLQHERLTWHNNGPMEAHFMLEAGTETIYDPFKSLVALYPQEHARNVARLEAMGLDLYRHTIYDASQAAMKRHVMNCKPQRMGKTSEAIATCLLWGSKRIGFISPNKDTRQDVKAELERLGLHDYVIVDSLDDLERGDKANARWYLMYYGFMKGLESDPAPAGNDKFESDTETTGPGEMYARCPHCNEVLQRWEYESIDDCVGRWRRELKFGYACVNEACSYQQQKEKVRRVSSGRYRGRKAGAAWWDPDAQERFVGTSIPKTIRENGQVSRDPVARRTGSGYIDYERAKLAKYYLELKHRSRSGEIKDEHPKLQFQGRMHPPARFERTGVSTNASREYVYNGFVKKAWSPARYRRMKKFFSVLIVDEAHALASGWSSDQSRCILGLQAKHRITLTGTPMPNSPSDPYWQCHWTFGGGSKLFPYTRGGKDGYTAYWKTFCKNVDVTNSEGVKRKKKLPIATAPMKQRKLHAPLIIRRTFSDPLVIQSLQEKGLHYPTVNYHTIKATPDPYQADLLVNAMDRFQQIYNDHTRQMQEEEREVNTAFILSSMSLMKTAATCPDFLNKKMADAGIDQIIYQGVPGGGKTREIRRIVHQKLAKGEKVVVLSFYKHELSILMDCLADYGPTLYDIDKWDDTERYECRQRFLKDPNCKLLLGSIQALQVGVDLSSANSVICCDLLWSPGKQDQAVARILKPLKIERNCDVYYCVLEHSLDEHVFNTFYAKRVASEQILDGVITTPRPVDFNIRAFVDQVLAERSSMMKYALDVRTEETNYIPMLNTLATLGDRE